jgi:hypothetical protein
MFTFYRNIESQFDLNPKSLTPIETNEDNFRVNFDHFLKQVVIFRGS